MDEGESTRAHLSAGALDELRTGEGTAADAAHLLACRECRAAYEEIVAIASELGTLSHRPVEIAPEVEARILWRARKQARAARAKPGRRLMSPAWAVAASIVALLGTAVLIARDGGSERPTIVADLSGDGIVDVRDALLLARKLERAPAEGAEYDINHDGLVDRRDVDAIAQRSVSL